MMVTQAWRLGRDALKSPDADFQAPADGHTTSSELEETAPLVLQSTQGAAHTYNCHSRRVLSSTSQKVFLYSVNHSLIAHHELGPVRGKKSGVDKCTHSLVETIPTIPHLPILVPRGSLRMWPLEMSATGNWKNGTLPLWLVDYPNRMMGTMSSFLEG